MNHEINERKLEALRRMYPSSSRVTLLNMDDPQAPPPGTKGTVLLVDALGQLCVNWDNGSTLSLIPGKDHFSKDASGKEGPAASRKTRAPER